MKARTSLVVLLAATVAAAVLPALRGIAWGWPPDGVTETAAAPTGAGVETAVFAVG